MADCSKGKKARSSYNRFLSDANWDENEVAQRKVDLFIDKLCLKDDDKILLIIDDTYNEKNGTKTDGVGRFYDHRALSQMLVKNEFSVPYSSN
jgi:SRSO17 transposase